MSGERKVRRGTCVHHVLDTSQSKGTVRLVLLAIASFADPDGSGAYPSVKSLADCAGGVSVKTVRRSIAALVRMGELEVHFKKGPKGCNSYTVTLPDGISCPPHLDTQTSTYLDTSGPDVDTALTRELVTAVSTSRGANGDVDISRPSTWTSEAPTWTSEARSTGHSYVPQPRENQEDQEHDQERAARAGGGRERLRGGNGDCIDCGEPVTKPVYGRCQVCAAEEQWRLEELAEEGQA